MTEKDGLIIRQVNQLVKKTGLTILPAIALRQEIFEENVLKMRCLREEVLSKLRWLALLLHHKKQQEWRERWLEIRNTWQESYVEIGKTKMDEEERVALKKELARDMIKDLDELIEEINQWEEKRWQKWALGLKLFFHLVAQPLILFASLMLLAFLPVTWGSGALWLAVAFSMAMAVLVVLLINKNNEYLSENYQAFSLMWHYGLTLLIIGLMT